MTDSDPIQISDFPTMLEDYEDIHTKTSKRQGPMGVFEHMLRRFRLLMFYVLLAPIAVLYILSLGLSLSPGICLVSYVFSISNALTWPLQGLALGLAIGTAFVLFWLTLILIVPLFNLPFLPFVKPGRGIWFSLQTIPWYYHNALTQLVRYAVLDFITPTPFNLIFYRLMGMKLGHNCMINTSNISDPCLITMEDNVTIGGSVTIFAHYGMKGYLIIKPVLIKKGATVGLKASIMGGCTVGSKQTVPPGQVLMPNTLIDDLPLRTTS
jgi:carbonic anhydrase/acetyltransferase-like protein (isoleucine patch superfamily)